MNLLECLADETLLAYQNGTADAASIEAVAEHLRECPSCLGRLQSVEAADDPLLRALRQQQVPAASPIDPLVAAVISHVLPPVQTLAAGTTLHEYRLLEKLGSGGMGTVYRALHVRLDKEVALKVIHPLRGGDPHVRERFGREMKAIGKLRHPHIVLATDAGEAQGVLYLVMELEHGADLAKYVRQQGRLSVAEACAYAQQAALGLQYAHEAGLVHRDIKPSNLFRTSSGQIKILDLGLALLEVADESPPDTRERPVEIDAGTDVTPLDTHCTLGPMGTDDYMAPEQWNDAHRVDARADLYSLGCTMFFLLTGRPPFSEPAGLTRRQIRDAHLYASPPAFRSFRPDAPPRLEALLNRLLAKKPEERFPSAAEVARQLAAFARPKSRRRLWTIASGVLLAGLLASAALLNRPDSETAAPTGNENAPHSVTALSPGEKSAASPRPDLAGPPQPGFLPMTPAEARELQGRWAKYLGQPVIDRGSLDMEMVLVPPGMFKTGQRTVILSKPFRASATEVTIGQFRTFADDAQYVVQAKDAAGRGGYLFLPRPGKGYFSPKLTWSSPGYSEADDNHPVAYVCWDDAVAFCEWLSRREMAEYRLPTAAEWEWLCRAGANSRYHHGDDPQLLSKYGWYSGNSAGHPHAVGEKLPNAFGFHDTLGNVMEWCHDGPSAEQIPGEFLDPVLPSPLGTRLVVGGSYFSDMEDLLLTCSAGGASERNVATSLNGFRVIRVLPADQP